VLKFRRSQKEKKGKAMTSDRSKWDILQERRKKAQEEANNIATQLQGLALTPFKDGVTGRCSGCGALLQTEADFAKHFLIPDERFLNLGYCPNKKGQENES
jgi:hypothetical protein